MQQYPDKHLGYVAARASGEAADAVGGLEARLSRKIAINARACRAAWLLARAARLSLMAWSSGTSSHKREKFQVPDDILGRGGRRQLAVRPEGADH